MVIVQGRPVPVVIVIVIMTVVEVMTAKGVRSVMTTMKKDRAVLVDIGLLVECICQGTVYRFLNPLTPISDQNRISLYNINTISTRQVMRIKKNINLEIVDSILNSLN